MCEVKTFEQFYEKLTAHEIWFDQIKMRFYRRNLQDVARECYLFLLASGNRWAAQDYEDFRRCYLNFLKNAKDQQQGPQLQQSEPKKEESKEPIVTGEARKKYIDQWLESVSKAESFQSGAFKLTHKQIADEGGWLPKKPAPYPSCSLSEVRARLLHLEYIKLNYDPRTKEPAIDWIEEEDWLNNLTDAQVTEIMGRAIK